MGKCTFFWVKQENTPTKDTQIPPFPTDLIRQQVLKLPSPQKRLTLLTQAILGSLSYLHEEMCPLRLYRKQSNYRS